MGRKAKGLNKNKKNFNIEHPIQEVPGSGNLVTEEEVEPEMRVAVKDVHGGLPRRREVEEEARALAVFHGDEEVKPMDLSHQGLAKHEQWPSATDHPLPDREMGEDLRLLSPPGSSADQIGQPWRCRSCGAQDLGLFSKRQFGILYTGAVLPCLARSGAVVCSR